MYIVYMRRRDKNGLLRALIGRIGCVSKDQTSVLSNTRLETEADVCKEESLGDIFGG